MYPFGFIHMLPPHILVSCQVGQYLPKAMLAQNWIPQHWIQLHCFCNLVCHKPQKSLMLSAVLDPEHSLGTLSEFGDLVPVVSTRKISVISPQLWTDHDGSWWIIRITNEICEICICCASCALIAPKGICSAENLKILNDRLNICRVSLLELGHPATGSKRRRPASWCKWIGLKNVNWRVFECRTNRINIQWITTSS